MERTIASRLSQGDETLKILSGRIRRSIIEQSKRANVGHIGSALSIADIIAVLFGDAMNQPSTNDPMRDRFILSKGHAALALYSAMEAKGIITKEQLSTYCGDGSFLGVHPERTLNGIDISTGSLGHGLSIGAGIALAARMKNQGYRCYVLVSDAECNEGSLWETVMFAAHHRLSNLIAVVDDNGQQALGKTREIINLKPLSDKWRAFGWNVHNVDGHDSVQLRQAFGSAQNTDNGPTVLIARTLSGKGVSFMEGKVEWHYLPLSDKQYSQALFELEGRS
jgi:transketolase